MAEIGNLSSVSDVGSGAMAAYAGLKSAALNVFINLGGIKDEAFVSEVEAELNEILANQADLVEEVYLLVKSRI
jgi:formiminotetrahydrofolate cyclodeaminase